MGSKVEENMVVQRSFLDGEIGQLFLMPKMTRNTIVSE